MSNIWLVTDTVGDQVTKLHMLMNSEPQPHEGHVWGTVLPSGHALLAAVGGALCYLKMKNHTGGDQ